MNMRDYVLEKTERIIESDQYSHQQDAYDAGVMDALEAALDYALIFGREFL